ncbi:MAG: hypothetical protein KDD82_04810 [Planctomycetes bacterium]|nr:hypothetical protein [Planctomycetota bacterium]
MWMVKNTLRATLTFRGLDLSIPAGATYDLDALGRERAESSNQVLVAFEEGYLENVHKAARVESDRLPTQAPTASDGLTGAEFEARMKEFQRQFVSELKTHIPALAVSSNESAMTKDVKALVDEFKLLREHFELERNKLARAGDLSDAEVRARMAFLEEKENELVKNFERVGRRVETKDGDVMGKADMLSNL